MKSLILCGHVLDALRSLAADSVHCCVTSPPYWGLRAYGCEAQVWGGEKCPHEWGEEALIGGPAGAQGATRQRAGRGNVGEQHMRGRAAGQFCSHCGAWRGALGLEPTPSLYVEHIVEIFREVRRVLRPDGTMWLNLGDSFITKPMGASSTFDPKYPAGRDRSEGFRANRTNRPSELGLKSKDMVMIPARVALALQQDGWYLRQEIIWCKTIPMPESVRDRPTCATEKIFLLAKNGTYFYDHIALREPSVAGHSSGNGFKRQSRLSFLNPEGPRGSNQEWEQQLMRNMWNYWRLNPDPFPEPHFATFPREIPRRAIAGGTSERGCCEQCGAPWRRAVVRLKHGDWHPDPDLKRAGANRNNRHRCYGGKWADRHEQAASRRIMESVAEARANGGPHDNPFAEPVTAGWEPQCDCAAALAPCTVLDPFLGSGTTAVAAQELGRKFIGIELNPEYVAMAERRIREASPLFSNFEVRNMLTGITECK